jgi:hypothetical protein
MHTTHGGGFLVKDLDNEKKRKVVIEEKYRHMSLIV